MNAKAGLGTRYSIRVFRSCFNYHDRMSLRTSRLVFALLICAAIAKAALSAQTSAQSPASSSPQHGNKPPNHVDSELDPGSVTNGVYRNKALALSCTIPPGWVLRTDEMNVRDEQRKED